MDRNEIETKLKALLAEKAGADPQQITRETHFVEDLHLDSLDTVELIMDAEDAFHLTLPAEDVEQFHTFGDAVDYFHKHLGGEGEAGVGARLKPNPRSPGTGTNPPKQ